MLEKDKRVKFLDLAAAHAELKQKIDFEILEIAQSGIYLLGPKLHQFERNFSNYVDATYCAGVSNGLDALKLSLMAVGVGPGDEVIVPSHTFIATWLAVSHLGGIPVPVEPDWITMNIDPALIQNRINKRTKAILITHLYGLPANLDLIIKIAKKNDIPIIEDAAQAQGAVYHARKIGSHSDMVCWSFYPGKNLGAMGDAGAVTTNSPEFHKKIQMLRNYGSLKKYTHASIGFNCRLDEIQAAVLSIKLSHLDEWNSRRKTIADIYTSELAELPITLPSQPDGHMSSWHLYVIRTPLRDALCEFLTGHNCDVIIHYPTPPHMQECYSGQFHGVKLPITEKICKQVLSLPISPHHSAEDAMYVCDLVKKFFRTRQ